MNIKSIEKWPLTLAAVLLVVGGYYLGKQDASFGPLRNSEIAIISCDETGCDLSTRANEDGASAQFRLPYGEGYVCTTETQTAKESDALQGLYELLPTSVIDVTE